MNPAAWLDAALGILDDVIPDADAARAAKAHVRVAVMAALGRAHRILAIVFGVSLAVYIHAGTWVGPLLGVPVVIQWWAVLLQLAIIWALLGLDMGDLFKLWDRVRREREGE